MAEISANAGMPQRILYALETNQHKEGLTVAEIREVLELKPDSNKTVYNALRKLIIKRKIQCWSSIENSQIKVYSLPKSDKFWDNLAQQSERSLTHEARERLKEDDNHPIIPQLQLSRLMGVVMKEWNIISTTENFPCRSGIYAFYSGIDGICLYVGQARNLQSRGYRHWAWEQATRDFESPYAAYKIVESEHFNKTKRELIYNECLFIGLLRPCWNAATPRPRGDFYEWLVTGDNSIYLSS